MTKLSIIIPLYNEAAHVRQLLARVCAVSIPSEIIVVDDHSTDGSSEVLQEFGGRIKLITHERNLGKGAAIRSALPHVTGDVVIIQDADLEYDPMEYSRLIATMEAQGADVVYGSRFLGHMEGMSLSFRCGNRTLTWLSNLLHGSNLTDMTTCYKLIKTEVLRSLQLSSVRFEFDPEVTAKLLKRGIRIVECPISYRARNAQSGKKLRWTDGFSHLWCLLRNWWV